MKNKILLVAAVILFAITVSVRASYSYFYTENLATSSLSNWSISGNLSSQYYSAGGYSGVGASATGGGEMNYTGGTAGLGEVAMTVRIATPSTAYFVVDSGSFRFSIYSNSVSISQIHCNDISCTTWSWLTVGGAWATVNDQSVIRVMGANSTVAIYVDNVLALAEAGTALGTPGLGVFSSAGDGNLISSVSFGYVDSIAPTALPGSSITTSAVTNRVDIAWTAASDDTNGTGIYEYRLFRGSSLLATIPAAGPLSYSDTTVVPSTTYNYTLTYTDFHGNSTSTNFSAITTAIHTAIPPSYGPEGRRTGIRPTGAYWGASPENIDVLSGNLNFALPLLGVQGRSGWGVGFNLAYNSQNWRQDSTGTIWKWDADVGYGFGWRLMAGAITPVYASETTFSHYLFIDSTGAEYQLDQHTDSIWSSKESIYVWFDSNTNILHFRDGSFWTFGCVSAAGENDQGTLYPTVMEDTNGNQVLISYMSGVGAGWANSSARISKIEDVRAINPGSGIYSTYLFTYDGTSHLSTITSTIGTGENYSFDYTSQSLTSPFGGTSSTASMLTRATVTNISTSHQFTYDGSGELTKVVLPYKGYLGYDYTTATYSGTPSGRSYREVQHRYLSKDGTTQTTYPFTHEATLGPDVHSDTFLDDPGGLGEKHWAFNTSGTYEGLVSQYQGRQGQGSSAVTKMQNDFTWSQDGISNSFISTAQTTADPGTNQVVSKTTQSLDNYGNVLQVDNYGYGSLMTAARTSSYTYLNTTAYTSRYILNRLTQATLSDGTYTVNSAIVSYDGSALTTVSGQREWDTAYTSSVTTRGNPTSISTPGSSKTLTYSVTGGAIGVTVNGVSTSVSTTSTTNYAAPSAITVGSLTTNLTYSNNFLGLTNETGPNGNSVSLGYDSNARPNSSTSPFGGNTTISYADTATPPSTTTTAPDMHWSKTILDGLGRPLEVDTGYGTTTVSVSEKVYDSCGCSPLGKLVMEAIPHAPGATPVVYKKYVYDGLGRTTSAISAWNSSGTGIDSTGTTTYSYLGNTVTVTDSASNWKKFTTDAFGNLTQVNEPNPAGGSDFVTTYTYDMLGHLTGVSMPRGSTPQTRTFNYGTPPGIYLLSATNPENGTVTYTYSSYGKVATRIDQANQKVAYTYDSLARLVEVQRYPTSTGAEDTCQQENYAYGGANTFVSSYANSGLIDSSYSANASGRLASVQYYGGHNGSSSPVCDTSFTEMYSYGAPGAPVGKRLKVTRNLRINPSAPTNGNKSATMDATFAYDNQGRLTTEGYPGLTDSSGSTVSGVTLAWTYDSMGRLYSMKDQGTNQSIIDSASYGPAGELLSMSGTNWGTETRTYNVLKQLTQLSSNGVNVQYNYSATQNNGKISSQTDLTSGEQVSYIYDSLNRLISASTSGSGGSAFDHWSDGGAQSHSITVPPSSTTYTATYATTSSQVATPSFNVAAGTYGSSQTVTISSATAGADFYYTTNGSTPTTGSTHYTGAITVASTETLKAIGVKSGLSNSTVGVAAYTISSGGSWSNGYTYQRAITIDHTKVPNTDQSNFPVLISGAYSYLATTGNGGNVINSNGYDIIFTSDSAGTTPLSFERESWSAATGAVSFWVKVPTVSHTSDTVIYMFYGNSSVSTDQQNKTAAWDSNYTAVYHLPNGTTLSANDSTGNANNGTVSSATATTGKVGGGETNAAYEYIGLGQTGLTPGSITTEQWVYPASGSAESFQALAGNYGYYATTAENGWVGEVVSSSNHVAWYTCTTGGSCHTLTSSAALTANQWNHVVMTSDGTNKKIYINGALDSSGAWAHSIAYVTPTAAMGKLVEFAGYYFIGSLDEVRVSDAARSADWVATEYNSENSPSSFYSVGAPQTGGGGGGSVSITVTSSVSGMTMTVDGSNCTAPCTFSWTAGSSHTIAGPSGTGTSAWSQSYTYDGFGNLTAITGTQANSWSYDAATNHGPNSDANGNGNSAASSGAYTYDIENRIVNTGPSNGNYFYSYAPGNKRVWKGTTTYDAGYGQNVPAADEITFWSPGGQKMGTYNLVETATAGSDGTRCVTNFSATQTGTNYYFGGKLIKNAPGNVFSDRLGSVGKYYPYGSDKGSGNPASGEKFTGYQQDSETGLDYANNRYQQPGSGRFVTTDPLRSSASAGDPGSWNRYAYVNGDPVNHRDPSGLYLACPDTGCGGDPEPGNPTVDWGFMDGANPTDPGCIVILQTLKNDPTNATAISLAPYCGIGEISPGGGGGAGGGSATQAHITPQIPPGVTYTEQEQEALDVGLDNAWSRILSNTKCMQFLDGSPTLNYVAGTNLLGNFLSETEYFFGDLPDGIAAETDAQNVFSVTLNQRYIAALAFNGASVSATVPDQTGNFYSVTFQNAGAFTAYLLLHELGHQTGVLPPDADDATNGANTTNILTNCFTRDGTGVYK